MKQRNISDYLIKVGLKEIPEEEYTTTFHELAEKTWHSITEKNVLKKRKNTVTPYSEKVGKAIGCIKK
nr:hypothetical protein [Flavobacterium piscinae]